MHGYPSSRKDWSQQIKDLSAAGLGVLAPDLLGFGDSDRPVDYHAYRLKTISKDLNEVVGQEVSGPVVGVGHDWGSGVLSAFAVYYPSRFSKLAFPSAGYSRPVWLDIDAINAGGLKAYGYTTLGYWYFFNSYDTATVIGSHVCFKLTYAIRTLSYLVFSNITCSYNRFTTWSSPLMHPSGGKILLKLEVPELG